MSDTLARPVYTVVGCNDEQTVCDHCGRSDLARTVVLRDDEGTIVRMGTTCAVRAQAIPGVRTRSQLDRHVHAADAENVQLHIWLSAAAGNLLDRARRDGNAHRTHGLDDAAEIAFWTAHYDTTAGKLRARGHHV